MAIANQDPTLLGILSTLGAAAISGIVAVRTAEATGAQPIAVQTAATIGAVRPTITTGVVVAGLGALGLALLLFRR